MICGWFFIWPTLVLLAEAGATSSSAEGAMINAGAANGIVLPNGLSPGAVNGMVLNGQAQLAQAQLAQAQLAQAQLAQGVSMPQLVPVAQPMLISQPGLPIGQAGMLPGPGAGLPQALVFPVAGPQLQPINGVAPLFAVFPQGGLQVPVLNPGQAMQILPLGTGNNVMQPLMGAQGAGNVARKVKRSAPADSVLTAGPEDPEMFPVPTARPSLAEVLKVPCLSSTPLPPSRNPAPGMRTPKQLPGQKQNNPEMDQFPEEQNDLQGHERTTVEEASGSGVYLGTEVPTSI